MDIMGRIDLMKEYGIADQTAYDDLTSIVKLMDVKFNIPLTEENAGVMVTHLAAAFQRNITGEDVGPLSDPVLEALRNEPDYPRSRELSDAICATIKNRLSTREQDYLLMHLCTLLYGYNKEMGKEDCNR